MCLPAKKARQPSKQPLIARFVVAKACGRAPASFVASTTGYGGEACAAREGKSWARSDQNRAIREGVLRCLGVPATTAIAAFSQSRDKRGECFKVGGKRLESPRLRSHPLIYVWPVFEAVDLRRCNEQYINAFRTHSRTLCFSK